MVSGARLSSEEYLGTVRRIALPCAVSRSISKSKRKGMTEAIPFEVWLYREPRMRLTTWNYCTWMIPATPVVPLPALTGVPTAVIVPSVATW
jgi:hypothetical protein